MKAKIITYQKKITKIEITINDNRYHLKESVDGKLVINKPGLDEEALVVFPRYANEIEIK